MNPDLKKQLTKIFLTLFGIFSTLLIALAFKFYFALSTNEPAMTDRYYEIGKDYDAYKKSEKSTENRNLDLKPSLSSLRRGQQKVLFSYQNVSGEKTAPQKGRIHVEIVRRATMKGSIQKDCETDQNGNCEISLNLVSSGFYEIKIKAEDEGGRFIIREMIEIP